MISVYGGVEGYTMAEEMKQDELAAVLWQVDDEYRETAERITVRLGKMEMQGTYVPEVIASLVRDAVELIDSAKAELCDYENPDDLLGECEWYLPLTSAMGYFA